MTATPRSPTTPCLARYGLTELAGEGKSYDPHANGRAAVQVANGAPAPFYDCTVAGQNCARFANGEMGLHTLRARLSYQFN
jgi:hypothetical protein